MKNASAKIKRKVKLKFVRAIKKAAAQEASRDRSFHARKRKSPDSK